MAKIYLAARYERRLEMVEAATQLEAQGHTVVSTWITGTHETRPDIDATATDAERAGWAEDDMWDLASCDIMLSFSDGANSKSRGGRHVEFGIGLAFDKWMVLIGAPEHIFHCLPGVERYESLADFLEHGEQ